jgi:hypothetical protein
MKDLTMFHGTYLVTKESNISDELRIILLNHPYFHNPYRFDLQDTFINGQPESEYDLAVFQFLQSENVDYSDRVVEYWFQDGKQGLSPHCDYNFVYRDKMKFESNDWPHKVDKSLIVSPITLAVYLEVTDDMTGGELCISSRTWYEEDEPAVVKAEYIMQYPYDTITPAQSQVLYFMGSENYHWVNKVKTGARKSMLINFWPKELLDK